MKRLLYAQLEINARRRPPGYVDAFKARATLLPTHIEISPEAVAEIDADYPLMETVSPQTNKVTTLPTSAAKREIEKWPRNPFGMFARGFKLLRTKEDTGIGDTIARLVGPVGGDAYKQWFKETFGKSCGCTERQQDLNERFPY
jgi:hypothetical protein